MSVYISRQRGQKQIITRLSIECKEMAQYEYVLYEKNKILHFLSWVSVTQRNK
jgi:hypothetical protein